MADNKVTIDVAWFDELRSTANGEKYKTLEAAYNQVRKERDELKAKLDELENNHVPKVEAALRRANMAGMDADKRLAAAERCIENILHEIGRFSVPDGETLIAIDKIIRAYRAAKEAK